ncbi:MAG: DUF1667 domain-containing protein [Synergistaceae bacterium]|nr:DUF1667 domain-containing protein [Synergistaceae bacterium]MBP9626993.1 DUF1667 domain-containing protein [Synergistaceae bacterium]MBP9958118.1 DUF1667 domain-containing protein [Synergistaceae bacterium]
MSVTREFICVLCPNGCWMDAVMEGNPPRLLASSGARCHRGEAWLLQEIENPLRMISTNVRVRNGAHPLVSVRTSSPIPLFKVFAVMEEIMALDVDAPVDVGQLLLSSPANCDTNIIATRRVS